MVRAKDAIVWVNTDTSEVRVVTAQEWDPGPDWCDPIGAHYTEWHAMSNAFRVRLMLETAVDLAVNGFSLPEVLRAFAGVQEFRALGNVSYPMCRALTKALIGESCEFNTMDFEELLVAYAPEEGTNV
jgi:hypothetical protein